MVKNTLASAGDIRNAGLISGLGRSPGEGNGKPLQYSCLENSMDRGAGELQSIGLQRVRHDWATVTHTHTILPFLLSLLLTSFTCNYILRPLASNCDFFCFAKQHPGVKNLMEQSLANTLWKCKSPNYLHWVGKNSEKQFIFRSFLRIQAKVRLWDCLKLHTCSYFLTSVFRSTFLINY